MSIIIFLIVLSALVLVHELGHFSVAKFFGIRVDEFGLGLPPRAKKLFSWKGTDFTLNWLPFGGFVKIFGEDGLELSGEQNSSHKISAPVDSLQGKNRGIQASVMVAGVVCNFIFAWLLISLGFVIGIAAPAGLDLPIKDPQTVITAVLPDSPADKAGLKSGDTILSLSRGADSANLEPELASEFIASSDKAVTFELKRGEDTYTKTLTPVSGLVPDRVIAGITMETVGTTQLPVYKAVWYGLLTTSSLIWLTAKAIAVFVVTAFSGKADFSSVTGPVGLVGLVGDASKLGFSYLVTFTALISINLGVINLLPFPALDGGRILFILIESATRRRLPVKAVNYINTAGFAILIFLMILVSIRDVRHIL